MNLCGLKLYWGWTAGQIQLTLLETQWNGCETQGVRDTIYKFDDVLLCYLFDISTTSKHRKPTFVTYKYLTTEQKENRDDCAVQQLRTL